MFVRKTMVRSAWCLLGLGVAAGIFAAGRGTAGDHHDGDYRTGWIAGHTEGLTEGRADGLQESRAEQETGALPPAIRDAAKAAFGDGYRADENDVFAGYDGGWSYATPYLITLEPGGHGVTYRIASRVPLQQGAEHDLCRRSADLCRRPHG